MKSTSDRRHRQQPILFDEPLSIKALERKINRINFGWFQVQTIIMCGFFFFYQSAISREDKTISYLGLMVGFGLSVLFASFSRRVSIILGYALMAIATYMAAGSSDAIHETIGIVIAHVGVGLGLPGAIATVGEFCPKNYRGFAFSLMLLMNVIGDVYAKLMKQIVVGSSSWCPVSGAEGAAARLATCQSKLILELISIPIFLILIISAIGLSESPIALTNDCFALNSLLKRMRETNGFSESDILVKFVPSNMKGRLSGIGLGGGLTGACAIVVFATQAFQSVSMGGEVISSTACIFLLGIAGALLAIIPSIWKNSRVIIALGLLICAGLSLAGSLVETGQVHWPMIRGWIVFGSIKSLNFFILVVLISALCDDCSRRDVVSDLGMVFGIGYMLTALFSITGVMTTVTMEIAFACIFTFSSIFVWLVPHDDNVDDVIGVKFSKIPIIATSGNLEYYGSLVVTGG